MTRTLPLHEFTSGVVCRVAGINCYGATFNNNGRDQACLYCRRCCWDADDAGCRKAPRTAPVGPQSDAGPTDAHAEPGTLLEAPGVTGAMF